MKPTYALAPLLALASLTSAWPWPPSFLDSRGLGSVQDFLQRRQHGGGNRKSLKPSKTTAGHGNGKGSGGKPIVVSSSVPPPSKTTKGKGGKTTASTGKGGKATTSTGKGGTATTGKGSKATTSKLVTINPQDPAGGLSMVTPAATSGMQYYRVGQDITWVWNYTSLLRTPAHIDILATQTAATAGGANPSPYTLSKSVPFQPTQTFIWDTGEFTSRGTQLPIATYTLIVFDADVPGGITQVPQPGHLGVNEQFFFGMYTGQPYASLVPQYICATCNAAGGKMERLKWRFLAGAVALSMGTFVWVAAGNGVLL